MQEMSGLYMPVVNPNNFVSGAIKTVGCVTTGAMSTAACLLLIPAATTVSGYNNGGLLGGSVGFIGGSIAGAITGSLVAVTFTLQGVQQLVQGIFRTPGAIIGYLGGKDWDDLACEWVYTDLKEEANLFLNMTDEQFLKTVEKAGGISYAFSKFGNDFSATYFDEESCEECGGDSATTSARAGAGGEDEENQEQAKMKKNVQERVFMTYWA